MAFKDLIPWNRNRDMALRRDEEPHPFLALHREMNRLFDDAFRSFGNFGAPTFANGSLFDGGIGWPRVEVDETDREYKVTAELPGMEEKDFNVELVNGVLKISGEKKSETEDRARLISERYYGRFERRIPVDEVQEDRVTANFKDGILTVTLPKSEGARENVKRITVNGGQ